MGGNSLPVVALNFHNAGLHRSAGAAAPLKVLENFHFPLGVEGEALHERNGFAPPSAFVQPHHHRFVHPAHFFTFAGDRQDRPLIS